MRDERDRPQEHRIFLVEAADYAIIDTWFAAGLRGTGSKDVEMAETFVPSHRTLPLSAIAGGPTPGSAVNPAPLYQLPALGLFSFVVAAVSLGIARGAVADYTAATRARVSGYTGTRLADFATQQLRLAEAAALADTAEALMLRDCDEATRIIAEGAVPSIEEKARWRRDGAYAAGMCTRAVDLIFTAVGRRRDLSRRADSACLPRHSCGQCPLRAELGRQRHLVGPGRAGIAAGRADTLSGGRAASHIGLMTRHVISWRRILAGSALALLLLAQGGSPGTTILNPPAQPPAIATNPTTVPPALRIPPWLPVPGPAPGPAPSAGPAPPSAHGGAGPIRPAAPHRAVTGYGTGGMQQQPGAPPNPPYPPGGLLH